MAYLAIRLGMPERRSNFTRWFGLAMVAPLTLGWLGLAPARARAHEADRIALVVEASLSPGAEAKIREELARLAGISPGTLGELADFSEAPRVTLTVASAPRGSVRVFYWDATGVVDALAVPSGATQVELLAATLAAALLVKGRQT
jgi:hypothetical protein